MARTKSDAPLQDELPPVDPDAFERAARRFINAPPPPGGWGKAGKSEKPKKEGGGK